MKNKKGFVKFESLTIFFVIILLFAVGLYIILGMSNKAKFDTMNKSANGFVDASTRGENTFTTSNKYFLIQAIDEGLLKSINSPVSKGNCDEYESFVEYDPSTRNHYVTLKCGDYLIKHKQYKSDNYTVYKVGPWSDTKTNDDDDTRTVYTCNGCGVDGAYEDVLFVYLYNKTNGESNSYVSQINGATSKTQYRTLTKEYEK